MFIKISALQRKMKEANKVGSLRIGCDPGEKTYCGYYIAGSWWCVHIGQDSIPNEIKGEIVKYVGELPGEEREYQILNGYAQGCIYGSVDNYLPEWWAKASKTCRKTRYILGDPYLDEHFVRVYQDPVTMKILGVDERFHNLIDLKNEESEVNPFKPVLTNRDTLIWSDSDTYLEIYPTDISRTKFAEYMKGKDLSEPDNPEEEDAEKDEKEEKETAESKEQPASD